MKIALVCEVLHPPFDEGVRIMAMMLARSLSSRSDLVAFSSKPAVIEGIEVHPVLDNRWFLSQRLGRLMADFHPDVILYIPWTSLTERTLIRCRVLRRYSSGVPIMVLAAQPRPVGLPMRLAAFMGKPDYVLSLGPGTSGQARSLGIPARSVPVGVDTGRFTPASPGEKASLRQRAGIDPGSHVVLHVGHLKESRNVGVLEAIASLEGVTAVLVASTSTQAGRGTAERLRGAGVLVMSNHQDRIEFAYRLADTYIFPVKSPLDAIEQPFSVLEAAGCGLSIISTPFGGLPDLFRGAGTDAIVWEERPERFPELIAARLGSPSTGSSRKLVETLTWDAAADRLVDSIRSLTDLERR